MPTYKEKKQKLKQLVKLEEKQRIQLIQQQGYAFKNTDAFRICQKHYKYYMHRKTDYSEVVDVEDLQYILVKGLKVYEIASPEGAYLVKGFSNPQEQFKIGFEALNQYAFAPYRTNLDGTNGLYKPEEESERQKKEAIEMQEREEREESESQKKEESETEEKEEDKGKDKPQVFVGKEEGNETEIMHINSKHLKQSEQNKGMKLPYYFNQRIRMANLGLQYDWPHRTYPNTKVPIPFTIQSLIHKATNLYEAITQQNCHYSGEAIIVNYYKHRDSMIGHLDDGEQDQVNPIFSFCYGLSCVFLLGYPQKQKKPIALKLDSGDLLIMSGYSRICYHGVPRIIEESFREPMLQASQNIRKDIDIQKNIGEYMNGFEEVLNYFKTHRLNVNIRQVWSKGREENQESKNEFNQQLIETQGFKDQ